MSLLDRSALSCRWAGVRQTGVDVADGVGRWTGTWSPLGLASVVVLALRAESGWTVPVGKRNRQSVPDLGPRSQAVTTEFLAHASDLEFCEHEQDGFSMWIATRPGMLLCKFCYQAAQVLAQDILCAACGQPAGNHHVRAGVDERLGKIGCKEADLAYAAIIRQPLNLFERRC